MTIRRGLLMIPFVTGLAGNAEAYQAAPAPNPARLAYLDAEPAGPDFAIQGEYLGHGEGRGRMGAQVIAEGDGKFAIVVLPGGLPGEGWDGKTRLKAAALRAESDDFARITGEGWAGKIGGGKLDGLASDGSKLDMRRVLRESPLAGLKPPPGAIVLFDGSGVDHWNSASMTDDHLLKVGGVTKRGFRDFAMHVEFRTPFMPYARGQNRGNSGVYLLRLYEVQILDSFGLDGKANECGSLYTKAAPSIHMCYPPLSWQTYDIECRAARFDTDGNKIENAMISVLHNGIRVQDEVILRESTHKGYVEKDLPATILLQNHNTPVTFRNVWICELRRDDPGHFDTLRRASRRGSSEVQPAGDRTSTNRTP
ncbi:MAG: DUF1080 domain-containing protein [Isosphaeraceae bacterium]